MRQLKSQLESYTSISVSDAGTDPSQVDVSAHVLELKLKALILDMIHNIEVVEQLNTSSLSDIADWQWQKQLRFVWRISFLSIKLLVFLTAICSVSINYLALRNWNAYCQGRA